MKSRSLLLLSVLLLGWAAGDLAAQQDVVLLPPHEYAALKAQGTLPPNARPFPQHAPPADEPLNTGEYRALTGPCDCWVEPGPGYLTAMSPNDDESSPSIHIPFPFNFYGQNYSTLYINNNGNVSFGASFSTYTAAGFPVDDYPMVAPFWADVDTRGAGQVRYKVTPTAIYVNWVGVGYYSEHDDKVNTFQLILTDGHDPVLGEGKNVSFCYRDMQWTTGDASDGEEGFGGSPANVGTNRGNGVNYIQFGLFDRPGGTYLGSQVDEEDPPFSGVDWLDYRNIVFNTYLLSDNNAPIACGLNLCDTLRLCVGQSLPIEMMFTSPETDQITTVDVDGTELQGYYQSSNSSGSSALINSVYTAIPADTGYHAIHYIATDNGVPALTTTVDIVIQVLDTALFYSNTVTVCDGDGAISLRSLLLGGARSGGVWYGPDGLVHSELFDPVADAPGDYIYVYGGGSICERQATVSVTTAPHVEAGEDMALAYCSWDLPDDLTLHLSADAEGGGTWLGPDNYILSTTAIDPATTAPGVYKYFLVGTAPCPNDTAFFAVAIPRAVDAGQDTAIAVCRDGVTFSLLSQLAGTPDATGSWSNPSGAIVGDILDPATAPLGIYTYTVMATAPCPTLSAQLTVVINAIPLAGADASLVICANGGETSLLSLLDGNPDVDGQWTDPLDSLHSGLLDPSLEISGVYTYVSIGAGACGHLSDTSFVNVHIDPLPVITYTAEPDSGCHPLNVRFTNTTDPIYVGNACIWDLGDGTAPIAECGSLEHVYELPGWYHLKLKVTTPQGCTDELIAPGAVLVDPAPQATFTWTPNPGTEGNSRLVFTAEDPYAVVMQWTFPEAVYKSGRQVDYTFPDVLSGDYPVCLTVTDRYGCADTLCDNISVVVPNFWAPLGFTPDGNGVNDVFMPISTDMAPTDYELLIFDRWGRLVYSTKNASEGWDGTGKGGGALPDGAYVWKLTSRPMYSSDKQDRFGVVTLSK